MVIWFQYSVQKHIVQLETSLWHKHSNFSVNSPKATIENSNEDYTDYDNVVDRRTQSQIINGVNESADHPSGLDPNYSIHVLHNPYYDGEEQLNGPKSIVQINNLYYGGE